MLFQITCLSWNLCFHDTNINMLHRQNLHCKLWQQFFFRFLLSFCSKYIFSKLFSYKNIWYCSVQTRSEDRLSEPTTAEYRTVPLRPHNVTFNPDKIGPYGFEVEWGGPDGVSEFDRYTVAISIRRKTPQTIGKAAL